MASFVLPIRSHSTMSPFFSMSESSKAQNTSSPNINIKVESPDYNHLISATPASKITDNHALAIAPFIKVELPQARDPALPAPHTEEELIHIARVASDLLLKVEADKVPHVHYPFTTTTPNINNNTPKAANTPTTSSEKTRRRNRKDRRDRRINPHNAPRRLFSSQSQKTPPLAHLKIFTRSYHCPPTSITPRARPQIKLYSKSYFDRQTGHFAPAGPKAELETEPRPKSGRVRFFCAKVFLAGPPEKTSPEDKRIFYQRRLMCRKI